MTFALARSPHAPTGYGSFGANLVKGLDQTGAEYVLCPDDRLADVPPTSSVVWCLPPVGLTEAFQGQQLVNFSMWEATRLPESFREKFHNFDTILVPCEQNRELFSRYHHDVRVVHLGYDSDFWRMVDHPMDRDFRILTAGAGLDMTGGRKGFDIAVKAFQAAFPDPERMDPRPRLVAKAGNRPPAGAPSWVEVISGWRKDPSALLDIVASCHAYLGPSRGEGWGYWPQQALATGIPAVISEIPAHMEYAHLPGFYTAPVREAPAWYFVFGDAGNWWEADIDALVDRLRFVYENYATAKAQAERGAEQMASQFTHRHMAQNLVAELDLEREVGPGTWSLSMQEFPVQVTRRLTPADCTVGNRSYDLTPGQTYWLPADVKRVLWEAGYLTPECQNDEPGRIPQGVLSGADH